MSEQNKSIVRRLVEEAWNKKNQAIIDELVTPNCLIHTPDGDLRGPMEYRQLHDKYSKAFPDCTVSIEDMIAEEDKVVARLTFRGRQQGEFRGFAPTNKQVTVRCTTIVRLASGKVAEEHSIWDSLGLMEQLGIVTLPSQTKAKGAGR
jgi:steroid delta-isomerase-like uncharacterized protein